MQRGHLLSGSFLILAAHAFLPGLAWAQGDPLGPEFRVNTYTTSIQRRGTVVADATGNFVVVWTGGAEDGSGYGVFGQRYASSGAPLGPEFRVNTYTTNSQYIGYNSISVRSAAFDSSGKFVVVWTSDAQDGSGNGIFGQRYDSSGIPLGLEFRVNTYTTDNQAVPSVAADPSGNFVVFWGSYGQDGSGWGMFGQRFASSGTPLGPEFGVNSFTTGDQQGPAVAADSSGNFTVVWDSLGQDGSSWGSFGQRFASSGNPLGPEFRVNTYTTGFQGLGSVVADPSGNFVVVWTTNLQDGSSYGIFGQRYDGSGAPLGPEFRVNAFTTAAQAIPSVTADSSGNFVVVWQSLGQDGSNYGVFGQRYANTGIAQGPEFRVNTYTTSLQGSSSASADSLGNFVVVWTGNMQDGSSLGVFGQRYSQVVPVELTHLRVE